MAISLLMLRATCVRYVLILIFTFSILSIFVRKENFVHCSFIDLLEGDFNQ